MARTTVPTAGPPSVCTTTRSPGAAASRRRRRCRAGTSARGPTGVSLTATSGRTRRLAIAHSCSTSQSATILTPAFRSQRDERAIDRRKRPHAALAAIRRRQPLERRAARRDWRARARPRRVASTSTSRSSDAIARRCAASCSRSLAPPAPVFASSSFAPSIRRARIVAAPPPAPARAARRRAPRPARRRSPRAPAEAAVGGRRHRARFGLAAAARHRARVAMSAAESGRNRSCGQRDRTVGSSTSGRDGHQHEHRRRRRLFERLEQRVLRRGDERVGLVDDHDAAASFERPVRGAIDDVAHLIDLDRRRCRPARRTRTSGCTPRAMRVHAAQTPQASSSELGTSECGSRQLSACATASAVEALADAGRPGENQARRQRAAGDRSRQQIDQTDVADDVSERHGSGMLSRASRPFFFGRRASCFVRCVVRCRCRAEEARPEAALLLRRRCRRISTCRRRPCRRRRPRRQAHRRCPRRAAAPGCSVGAEAARRACVRMPRVGCRSQYAVGSVPRAKYSV